jgi:hypothetical protein
MHTHRLFASAAVSYLHFTARLPPQQSPKSRMSAVVWRIQIEELLSDSTGIKKSKKTENKGF